uniref:Uncharacterized protein n=1 Tax=Panagrolaimus superbus TaxID=310955 RepID=A0A914Z434_9BILA
MKPSDNENDIFKIVMFGSSGVGKYSIFERFIFDKYRPIKNCIIGAEFANKKIKIYENDEIQGQLWTTSGNERYRPLIKSYVKDAQGIILVYDITDKNSFDEMKLWFEELCKHVESKITLALIGNKNDLESSREISTDIGSKFAEEHQFLFFEETSALNSTNVEKVFVQIFKKIVEIQR